MKILYMGAMCLSALSLNAGTVSGSSAAVPVDASSPQARICTNTAQLAYSPLYASATADDAAYVIIRKVDAVSSIGTNIVTCAPGSGTYAYTPETHNDHRVRLSLTAYDSSNTQIGSVLTADLVTPFATGTLSAGVKIDTRVNSLQELAEAGGTAALSYSTLWATNGTPASLKISCERVRRTKQGVLIGDVTNDLFSVAAPATGDFAQTINPGKDGTFTYRCTFLDANGKSLGEDLTASYDFPVKAGLVLLVK